jgi:uncharacterized protein YcaQ
MPMSQADLPRISKTTARRFVLGRQGLWPGRRWRGAAGVTTAMGACEAIQMDPLAATARNHDLTLFGRVLDYTPALLDQVVYAQRGFFDYGGTIFLYPMNEIPYWRVHMRRRGELGRWADYSREHADLLEAARAELLARGPLANRDLAGNARVDSYRGRKDTSVAFYALWITGETMIHHRRRFERVYDLRANIVPPGIDYEADEPAAEAHFARKALAFPGIARARPWAARLGDYLYRQFAPAEGQARLQQLVEAGQVAALHIEDSKDVWYVLAEDLPALAELEAGRIPAAWQPLETTTLDEAVPLAPLDIVSARGRAKWLFGFDYIWEVYKPVHLRRWGYYTLPILYGDRLVARMDARLERPLPANGRGKRRAEDEADTVPAGGLLRIDGFWLEDDAPAAGQARPGRLDAQGYSCSPIRMGAFYARTLSARAEQRRSFQPRGRRAEGSG